MLSTEQIILGITIAVIVCTTIAIIIVLLRPKSGPPSPPPTPSGSSYFKAYVEDCNDAPPTYNLQVIKNLDILGLDFSENCYSGDKDFLTSLQDFGGKIFIHFDQTDGSHTCGSQPTNPTMDQKYFDNCAKTATTQLGEDLVKRINGVLWEHEANKFMDACESSNCKSPFSNAFKQPMLFAGWRFFEKAWESLPPNWDYQFIEMYNIYNQCRQCGADNCRVDYNPPPKGACSGNKSHFFQPAMCGPKSSSGCNYGEEGMYSNKLSIEQQAKWIATILKGGKKPKVPNPSKTVIFFPFTSRSKPSFKDIITTEDQFNDFVKTFIDEMKDFSPGIENCMYGSWGAPKWIAGS